MGLCVSCFHSRLRREIVVCIASVIAIPDTIHRFKTSRIHNGRHQPKDDTHRCWSIDRFRLFLERRARFTKKVHVEPRQVHGETHKHDSNGKGDRQQHAASISLLHFLQSQQSMRKNTASQGVFYLQYGDARSQASTCTFNLPRHAHTPRRPLGTGFESLQIQERATDPSNDDCTSRKVRHISPSVKAAPRRA